MDKLSDRFMYYCGLLAPHGVSFDDLKHIQNLIDKQEQGLLISLPCKVGDTVYFISREDIIPVEIDSISINENALLLNGTNKEHYGYSRITLSTKGDIYFTRSEATEALAKMGGK